MAFRLNVILTSFKSSFNPADCPHSSKLRHHLLSAFSWFKHYSNLFVCITSLSASSLPNLIRQASLVPIFFMEMESWVKQLRRRGTKMWTRDHVLPITRHCLSCLLAEVLSPLCMWGGYFKTHLKCHLLLGSFLLSISSSVCYYPHSSLNFLSNTVQ